MPSNKFILLCSHCGWKVISGPEFTGLKELKNDSMSSRKFRCEKCGRGVSPLRFPDPQSELDRKAKEERLKSENESFMDEAMEFQRSFREKENDERPEGNTTGH